MEFFAYLDPGSGSLILQAIIGGAVAVGVVLKAYWHKLRGLFSKGSEKKSEDLRSASKSKEKK